MNKRFKVKDHYFNKAKQENFVARSVYKLDEVDKKHSVIKRGNHVLDLGYYPGSWLQYTLQKVGKSGSITGIDLKDVNEKFKFPNVFLKSMDMYDLNSLEQVDRKERFNVLLSDMAPNTSGIKSVDQIRSLQLVERVFELCENFLIDNGNVVVKVFDSQEARDFVKSQKKYFKEIHNFRPKSVRAPSKEYFVVAKGYNVQS